MRIIDPFVICSSPHPGAIARHFTPKMLRVKECTLTPYPFVVFTLDS